MKLPGDAVRRDLGYHGLRLLLLLLSRKLSGAAEFMLAFGFVPGSSSTTHVTSQVLL